MKKIVFLGCENSHSAIFLDIIKNNPEKYGDIESVGAYSHEIEAAEKLNQNHGVPVLKDFGDKAGDVDGIVVTARDGARHLKYALPYLKPGVSVFMDKPITITEEDSLEFIRLCKENGVKLTGGSSCIHAEWVREAKRLVEKNVDGRTLGGYVRCPVNMNNPHGGFFFYSQHLVEIILFTFGYDLISVIAHKNGDDITVTFRYDNFDVTGLFVNDNYKFYYVMRMAENSAQQNSFVIGNDCFVKEFDAFYDILNGADQIINYKEFIMPVFVMNAIKRSVDSGNEESIHTIDI